ncbi:caspase family protein [Actinotalea ferrariae]|uniref:caspase family protein n=1 Tax=Actinotalea ferrariae TaxID=1386098 RepID=UPI001C8B4B35|nr:caspase family protein [Actinotalea ferrariae]MBX9245273.1 caspase family protein [Actinotalea ferrariae]
MAGQVYALLVGIDDYPAPVPRLRGCVNDVTTLRDLLRARVGDGLHERMLLDAEATREGLRTAFTEHLGQAGPGDVALLCYSGHGSQQRVPDELLGGEGDRLDETLVLHDSRVGDGHDLADKELGAWVAAVADAGPHVVVVLDCCHSGSGTRAVDEDGERERRAPTDDRPRSLESYREVLEAVSVLEGGTLPADDGAPGARAAGGALDGPSGWAQPRAPHVLLAACRSTETAKELQIGGRARGVLSAALETALSGSGTPTYRELHRFVVAQAHSRVRQQNPQLETTRAEDLELPFLGGAVSARPTLFVLSHEVPAGWVLDGGSLHGIPAPVGEETTHLAVPAEAEADEGQAGSPAAPLAEVAVTAVEPGRSRVRVEPEGALDRARTYRAVVTALPLPPVRVVLSGDAAAVDALRAVLPGEPGSDRASLVRETTHPDAELSVEATPSGYRVGRPGSARALVAPVDGSGADAAGRTALVLEHLARWTRVAGLRNPATALTGAVRVRLALDVGSLPAGQGTGDALHASPDGVLLARYARDADGTEHPPPLTLTLENTSSRPLWCAVVDLPGTYGISADAMPAGAVELAPGAVERLDLVGEVPDHLWERGVHELDDLIKVVVSTDEFDPRSLTLPDLDVGRREALPVVRDVGEPTSTLDRLLQRSGTRQIRPRPKADERRSDWTTVDVLLRVERPPAGVPIGRDAASELGAGVALLPHPALRGAASLESSVLATRDVGAPALPAVLRDAPDESQPFPLTATRGDTDALDTLALTGVSAEDAARVTEGEPLRLRLDADLGADEHLLPFAWDGEYYVPLGAVRRDDAGTEVVIERLPRPVVTERDLVGSIKILFRKLVGKRIGLPYTYPLLRRAVVEDGALRYDGDRAAITAAVGRAQAVLLYVHGIIGDTAGMALSSGHTSLDPPPPLLAGRYDVVLTFDYENIHTPIGENARSLGTALAGVGLDGAGLQRLDVVAHSMGGLVSRHFIELGGGATVVDRLVTLGTPNGGSPWPTVQKYATAALTLGLNGLTSVAWPVAVLSTLMGALEKVDVALDEMEPGSGLVSLLAGAPDPGVPYTVLVGTRSVSAPVPPDGGWLRQLLARVHPLALVDALIDQVFAGLANDIAVSVPSGKALPTDRSPAPAVHEVPSDHMSYFQNPEALTRLAEALAPWGPAVAVAGEGTTDGASTGG